MSSTSQAVSGISPASRAVSSTYRASLAPLGWVLGGFLAGLGQVSSGVKILLGAFCASWTFSGGVKQLSGGLGCLLGLSGGVKHLLGLSGGLG